MQKSFKYRIYPDREQKRLLAETFGCVRWVYNQANGLRMDAFKARRKLPAKNDLVKTIPAWKADRPWLRDADSMALQQAVRDCCRAWESFFRDPGHVGLPKFKSRKHHRQSYRTNANGNSIRVIMPERGKRGRVRLPKVGEVRAKVSRPPRGRVLSATVERTASGRYFVSVLCDDVSAEAWPVPEGAPSVTGVDAGIKSALVTSAGEAFDSPRALKRLEARLAREQRKLSRRKPGSARRERQRVKVARVHEKIANIRRDALHKATTTIVRESQAVAVEDLNAKGMMANHRIAKAAGDASMGAALRMLEWKCAEHGRPFVRVGRFYPSSKTCSVCGAVYEDLTLAQRAWACPACGARHDRDANAAVNIAREGARLLEGTHGTAGHAGTADGKAA